MDQFGAKKLLDELTTCSHDHSHDGSTEEVIIAEFLTTILTGGSVLLAKSDQQQVIRETLLCDVVLYARLAFAAFRAGEDD